MKQEDVKKLVETGVHELHEALANGKSEQLKVFLEVMSRFPRYSFGNCMLIALQKPDARMVQGFHAWKKLGRHVKKGETGIGIFAPMVYRKKDVEPKPAEEQKSLLGFKVVHVFDVSQTEGTDLPEFTQLSGEPGEYVELIERVIQDRGIELEYANPASGAEGVSQKGKIIVRPDLGPADRFAVLAHELGHELLHADLERRKQTTKSIRETEAEAVAHVVCRAIGIDSTTRSADYIQLYHGDVDVLAASLDAIQRAASQILDSLAAYSQSEEELAA